MDIDRALAIIAGQEEILRFGSVSEEDLQAIGKDTVSRIRAMGRCGIVEVNVNGLTIFMESINANTDNMEWVRRKRNLASRFWRSSLRTALEYRKTGKTLEGRGMDWHDYALSGGSFPILLKTGLPVGTITVSGMTEWEDHQTAADAIAAFLGMDIERVEP